MQTTLLRFSQDDLDPAEGPKHPHHLHPVSKLEQDFPCQGSDSDAEHSICQEVPGFNRLQHSEGFLGEHVSEVIIAYLRIMFPEEAFVRKSLQGLPLRILKEQNNCEKAGAVAPWLVAAFDAIERKYLRQMILFVYLDDENPDDAHEVYTFRSVIGIDAYLNGSG